MVRPPCVDSNGMKKGAWSEEEDDKLRAYVMKYGHWNWRLLPKYAGLARCGKSCRLRWVNYLKPGVKRGGFDKEEEELIIKLHAQLGNKWSAIATKLPGRTDNEIKNFYHTRIEKTPKRSSTTTPSSKSGHDHSDDQDYCSKGELKGFDSNKIQESTPSFDHHNSSPHEITQSSEVDLWSDLFLTDTNCNIQNDGGFPKLIHHHEDLLIPPHEVLHYSGLSSSDSSYMSALDWIGDDEHSIMSSEYVVPSIQGSFWNESSSSNHPSGESPTQEQGLGDFYDPNLFHDCFDYGMNLFS